MPSVRAATRRNGKALETTEEPLSYGIRWRNFRGFSDTSWLELPPLTILIGPNSAGKTSVIAPLVILNQTMQSRDAGTPIVTNGALFDGGSFQNLLTDRDPEHELSLGIRFHAHEPKDAPKPIKKVGTYPPGGLEVSFRMGDDHHKAKLTQYTVSDIFLRTLVSRTLQKSGRYSISHMPGGDLTLVERKVLRDSKPHHFLFNATLDLREFIPKETEEGQVEPQFTSAFSLYLSVVSYVFAEIRSLLDDLSYVGPLRDRPRHSYPIISESPRSVGPTGDRAANLMRQRFSELQPRLDQWVRAFEFGDSVEYKDLSGDFFAINFLANGRATNIADAGFGASQVFPLIVQALASARQTLTLAEQPEIHLNPRLQSQLADLFVEMANTERRVIVETHSEHLLLRLRRLIAEGKIDNKRVALYFVEKNDDRSTIQRVAIGPNGHIAPETWPKGFFGDTLRESLALAAAQSQHS